MPSNSSCAAGQNDESHAVRYGLREAITVTNDKISGVSRCTGTFGSFKQAKDIFSTIPTELKLQIMENLCSTDILNVRLTSKECAKLGAEYMFKDGFTVRPHLRDMARLEKVSNNSLMAGSVKCLTLFTGDMHITDLSSAVTAYIKWPGRRQFVSGRLLHDHRPRTRRPRSPTAIHKVLKNTFSMESLEAHCNRARLQEILPRFRNLSEIIITSTRFPFAGVGNGLKAVWGQIAGFHEDIVKPECFSHMLYRGAPFQQREIVTMRYWDILLAAQSMSSPIQKLCMDTFPIESISRVGNAQTQKEFLDKFRRTTAQIRDVRVGFTYRYGRYSLAMARNIGSFFSHLQFLTHLDISWYFLQDRINMISIPFLRTLQHAFFKNKWQSLQSLRFRYMRAYEDDLMSFFRNHSVTLKYLHLSEWAMVVNHDDCPKDKCITRSYRDFFTNLKDCLKLEKFQFLIAKDEDQPVTCEDRL